MIIAQDYQYIYQHQFMPDKLWPFLQLCWWLWNKNHSYFTILWFCDFTYWLFRQSKDLSSAGFYLANLLQITYPLHCGYRFPKYVIVSFDDFSILFLSPYLPLLIHNSHSFVSHLVICDIVWSLHDIHAFSLHRLKCQHILTLFSWFSQRENITSVMFLHCLLHFFIVTWQYAMKV